MSRLQNNYTTIEQSKRLLELGVPADSADVVYYNTPDCLYDPYIITTQSQLQRIKEGIGTPCWSVGRLMEIFAICFDPDFIEFDVFADGTTFLQQMIDKFERWIDAMDFSKLEE